MLQAGPWGFAYTYTLHYFYSCQLVDAVTVVEDQSSRAIRVTAVHVDVVGDSPGTERTSASLAAFNENTTTGAIGPGATLSPLAGHPLVKAAGATVEPVGTSALWYDLVVRLQVLGPHPRQWQIEGISVTYSLGGQSYSAQFQQSIVLPPTNRCPE